MDRTASCLAAMAIALLCTVTGARAQFMTDLGNPPGSAGEDSNAAPKTPALGWISIGDDHAALRSGAEMSLRTAMPFFARQRRAPKPSLAGDPIDLGDARLEAGRFAGLQVTLPAAGLAWDMGVFYRAPLDGVAAAAAGTGDDALGVHGALRYDFGALAVTASLHYAPQYLAADKSAYYPMLAAEVPIGNSFTLSAGISRPWTPHEARFSAPDYTQWSISGTVNMLGFDVMLSYSESDGAGAAETPGTEALFKLKRSF